ncbi:hypothetical protein [Paenibacillus xylanexedens]
MEHDVITRHSSGCGLVAGGRKWATCAALVAVRQGVTVKSGILVG